jgi:hypothetical protein
MRAGLMPSVYVKANSKRGKRTPDPGDWFEAKKKAVPKRSNSLSGQSAAETRAKMNLYLAHQSKVRK